MMSFGKFHSNVLDQIKLLTKLEGTVASMVSALDPVSSGPSSNPGWVTALCSQLKHSTRTLPFFALVPKWGRGNLMMEVTL